MPSVHWHAHREEDVHVTRASTAAGRAEQPPVAVLTTAAEAARWLVAQLKRLTGVPAAADWSDSRQVWTTELAQASSVYTGAGKVTLIVDRRPKCGCRPLAVARDDDVAWPPA